MDYITKPVSRKDLRRFAKIFRDIFDVPQTGAFPVLEALERLPDVFDKSYYRVVENRKLSKKNPARCVLNKDGSFVIEIQKRIYDGAQKGIGAYLGFILHEILHIFMFDIGYRPIFNRSFANCEKYETIEWQVKAITGEVAIPYEESKGMTLDEIMTKYKVSKGFALVRLSK